MFGLILTSLNLLFAALVVGGMFGIWLSRNPKEISAGAFVEVHQHNVRTLNTAMPVLGAITGLLTLATSILNHAYKLQFAFLIVAFLCFVTAGLVTRFANQPINAEVKNWTPSAPPKNWSDLRDKWWLWHAVRTLAGSVGLILLIVASLMRTVN